MNGWRRSGILDAIQLGSQDLPPLDPFSHINLMSNEVTTFSETNGFDIDSVDLKSYKRIAHEGSEDKE